ncbi:hypothetical protein RQP46_006221 [Phenoliferia psychrophenolica]
MTAFVGITFSAKNIEVLLVGELLCGLPWGVFQTLTTSYAADLAPPALRQLLCSGVLKAISSYDVNNQWGYRLPFALQWMWPVPIFIGVIFAPESPWFLVRQGRMADAETSLRRLGNKHAMVSVDESLAAIVQTEKLEKEMKTGTSYVDCFRGVNLRRTEIVMMVWAIQIIAGAGLISFSTVFFEQAGLSVSDAFSLTLGNYALGAVGTISSWVLTRYVGRRRIYLCGLAAMTVALLAVGATGFDSAPGASWAAGTLVLVFSFIYQLTVGPVCYTLVSEMPASRLRAKSVALARISYNGKSSYLFAPFRRVAVAYETR